MTNSAAETILVVEDDPAVRRFLTRTLERNGFAVTAVGGASDGLAAALSAPDGIALAIIDMVMPGVSGLDLAAELLRERPGLPVLYISGHVGSVAMESIAQQFPQRVLFKPFTAETLLERVRELTAA